MGPEVHSPCCGLVWWVQIRCRFLENQEGSRRHTGPLGLAGGRGQCCFCLGDCLGLPPGASELTWGLRSFASGGGSWPGTDSRWMVGLSRTVLWSGRLQSLPRMVSQEMVAVWTKKAALWSHRFLLNTYHLPRSILRHKWYMRPRPSPSWCTRCPGAPVV